MASFKDDRRSGRCQSNECVSIAKLVFLCTAPRYAENKKDAENFVPVPVLQRGVHTVLPAAPSKDTFGRTSRRRTPVGCGPVGQHEMVMECVCGTSTTSGRIASP